VPHADVDEYRRIETSRRELLDALTELGYRRWVVTYYPPKSSEWCAQLCCWPQDVAEARDPEWARLFKARSFDADVISRAFIRQGYRAKAHRTAGLPLVRVLSGEGDEPPWPGEMAAGESWESDRLRDRLDVIPLSEVEDANDGRSD
jgi:hypothetical protein